VDEILWKYVTSFVSDGYQRNTEDMPVLMLEEGCVMEYTKLSIVINQPQMVSEIVAPLDFEPYKALQIEHCELFLECKITSVG
jgi:hypothetical protein